MSKKSRAPKDGYDFGTKEAYRRQLWNVIDDFSDIAIRDRTALYLETKEALETHCLLRKGYRAENLYPCNVNPAEVALANRNIFEAHGVRIKGHGLDVVEALRRLIKEGITIDAVNLDFTSPLGETLLRPVNEISQLMSQQDRPWVAGVNMLRGREAHPYNLSLNDNFRVCCIGGAIKKNSFLTKEIYQLGFIEKKHELYPDELLCRNHIIKVKSASYKSSAGTQTMLWSVFKVWPHDDAGVNFVVQNSGPTKLITTSKHGVHEFKTTPQTVESTLAMPMCVQLQLWSKLDNGKQEDILERMCTGKEFDKARARFSEKGRNYIREGLL